MRCLTEFWNINRGYFVVFGGFLAHLALGSFYTYGNIQPYMVDYMRNHSYSGTSVNLGNSVWIFGLTLFGMGMAVSAGGFLDDKIGPFLTVLIGGWFYGLNVCLTYFTIKTYLVVVALSDGLLAGFGMGLAYGVALATPCKWFPKRKGFIMGIIVAGFGLSATIFDFLQIYYISHKITGPSIVSEKIPESFYVLGLSYIGLLGIGSIFLTKPPKDITNVSHDDDAWGKRRTNLSNLITNLTDETDEINFKPYQLLFEFDFWILWFTFALNTACVVLLMSLFKAFGLQIKLSDQSPRYYLTIASVLGALSNCIGRIFWGIVKDHNSYKTTMLILTMTTAVLYPTFYVCHYIGDASAKDDLSRLIFFMIWIILLNFLLSGSYSIFPTICANLFGMKHVVANYGLLFTAASIGGAVTSIITTGLWYHSNEDGGDIQLYLRSFIAGGVMSLCAAGLTLLYRGKSLMISRFY